jgi:hypothetical protein
MSDLIYYCTFILTAGLSATAFVLARNDIIGGGNKQRLSWRFAFASVFAGLGSGSIMYFGTLWLLDVAGHRVNVGHGEVLIAAPAFNLCLGLVLAVVGKAILNWSSFTW